MASVQDDTQAKAFATRPDKCGLYLYRNQTSGSTTLLDVRLDGKALGSTTEKTFLFTWLAPGEYTLATKVEHDVQLIFKAEAGKLLFIRQEMTVGFWWPGCELRVMSEAEGKAGVRECKLAESKR